MSSMVSGLLMRPSGPARIGKQTSEKAISIPSSPVCACVCVCVCVLPHVNTHIRYPTSGNIMLQNYTCVVGWWGGGGESGYGFFLVFLFIFYS